MATKKYLSLDGLTIYDELIKGEISEGDSSTLADAKSYTDTEVAKKADSDHTHDDMYLKSEIDSKISAVNTSITNITSGSVVVKEAEHATSADSATTADTATNATNADVATKLGTETVGSTTKPIYLDAGVAKAGATYAGGTKVTLNGSSKGGSTASFYAPTGAGTSGQILTSAGSGAPTWADAETTRANISVYSTSEVDSALAGKSDTTHDHDADYDAIGAASTALESAKTYADSGDYTTLSSAKTYADSGDATTLASAKSYADSAAATVKNDLLNGAGTAYDTLKELGDLIDDNADAIEALETIASGKANASHTHKVADISDLTATATELNYMGGVTSNVQTQLNTLTTSVSGKAPTSHASTATTYGIGTSSNYGHVKLSDSTSSTSAATAGIAATPAAVKTAYDLANTAKTNAATAQTKADSAYTLAESKVASLSDLGITATAAELNILDGVTATAAELNILDGVTATTTELNYMDGVTSNVQTQLDTLTTAVAGKAASSHTHTITASASDDDIVVLTGTSGSNKVTYTASHAASGATSGSYGDSAAQTPAYGGTFKVPYVTVNATGHVTGISAHTVTIPAVDSALSSSSTNPVQNKVLNTQISSLTSSISANTSSISSHTTAISALQTAVNEITDITSEEIQALFA